MTAECFGRLYLVRRKRTKSVVCQGISTSSPPFADKGAKNYRHKHVFIRSRSEIGYRNRLLSDRLWVRFPPGTPKRATTPISCNGKRVQMRPFSIAAFELVALCSCPAAIAKYVALRSLRSLSLPLLRSGRFSPGTPSRAAALCVATEKGTRKARPFSIR